MTFCSPQHEKVKGTKYLWNKKLRDKRLWTGPQKILKIVEKLRMKRFLMHLLIYSWTLFDFDIKSHKIENTFKTHD